MTDNLADKLRDAWRATACWPGEERWEHIAKCARALLAKPGAMPTDKELEDFINAKMRDPISLVRDALEKYSAAGKPVATRGALIQFMQNRVWSVDDVLAALSHFAPPASNAPISRMSVHEMRDQMRNEYKLWSDPEFALHCARVAHRLAQPVPEVDADTEVKDWLSTPAGGEWLWTHMTAEQRRDAWRAAAAEKSNG